MMLYSMIEVTDQALKDRLVVTCDNQPFIAKAPLLILFLADYQRMFDFYMASGLEEYAATRNISVRHPGEGDFLLAVNDALIAAQSAVTAAQALGLGSCYIGDIMENYGTHREMFDLPDYTFPITLVCFGYPKNSKQRSGAGLIPRYEEKFVRFENRYKRFEPGELLHLTDGLEAWQWKGSTPEFDEGNIGLHQYKRKFAADFTLEMNRSVRAALEKWRGSATED
jgi:nitroreductase